VPGANQEPRLSSVKLADGSRLEQVRSFPPRGQRSERNRRSSTTCFASIHPSADVNATSGVVTIVSIVNRPRQARYLKNGPFKPYSRCSRSFLLPFSFSAASGGLERMKARQRRLPTYWRSRPSEVTPDTSRFHKRQTRFCLPPATAGCYRP